MSFRSARPNKCYSAPNRIFLTPTMAIQVTSFSSLLAFLLFLFVLAKTLISFNNKSSPRLPPGPPRLPLLGNLHQLLGTLPHRSLRDLALKYGPLMHLQLGQVSTVVVSSSEAAMEVLKHHDSNFADRPRLIAADLPTYGYADIVFSPYGHYWRQMRKICQSQLLSVKRVQSFRSVREDEVSNFIRMVSTSAKTSSSFNFSRNVYSLNYGITSRIAFGKKIKDQETYISVMREIFQYLIGFNVPDLYPSMKWFHNINGVMSKMRRLHRTGDVILENIVSEHKQLKTAKSNGGMQDLVDALLEVQQQDEELKLSNENIKATINDIFSAGSDTLSTTIEWAMSELVINPSVMERCQKEVRGVFEGKRNADEAGLHELKYLKSVIKETLRLHPPAPLLVPRECRERCVINGYEIPSKTRLTVNAWAIGHDPKCWKNAERFEPDRFLDSHIDYKGTHFELIPFGAGRRMCPGIGFAMASMELLLAQLLFHFDWQLPDREKPEELDMTESFGLTVKRREELYLVPILRQHD